MSYRLRVENVKVYGFTIFFTFFGEINWKRKILASFFFIISLYSILQTSTSRGHQSETNSSLEEPSARISSYHEAGRRGCARGPHESSVQ